MKPVVPALILALTAGGAQAALAPQYYQQARDSAPNVIVLEIDRVTAPARDHGACQVAARVKVVERGDLYRNGQAITVSVPCMTPNAQVPAGPPVGQPGGELNRGWPARAWVAADGELALDQFELLR